MSAYLIDTNVLSEVRKRSPRADPEVWSWWLDRQQDALFLSVITLGEIRKGIERLRTRDVAQALALDRWLQQIKTAFQDQMLEISETIADQWGHLQAIRPLPVLDGLLAASALTHDLILVTRNDHSDLVDTHFPAMKNTEEFVELDDGLAVISSHAQEMGYDAVVLFLDELILWLASYDADQSFISREGNKVVKLVESSRADRPRISRRPSTATNTPWPSSRSWASCGTTR